MTASADDDDDDDDEGNELLENDEDEGLLSSDNPITSNSLLSLSIIAFAPSASLKTLKAGAGSKLHYRDIESIKSPRKID